MAHHPQVLVPDVGPLDHAWDLLGEWDAELELAEGHVALAGKVTFRSWARGDLVFDRGEAARLGVPPQVTFTRTSPVTRTDTGGGALEWSLQAPEGAWTVKAILWPGKLILRLLDPENDAQVAQLEGDRSPDYWQRKYPVATG